MSIHDKKNKEDKKLQHLVTTTNDNKIDQDFPGFPHGHSKEHIINPESREDKKTAAINQKDGEKINRLEKDEEASDGSASAFSATEEVKE